MATAKERTKEVVKDTLDMVKGGNGHRDTAAKLTRFVLNLKKTKAATPAGGFEECGAEPDYGDQANWISHPRRAPGAGDIEDANHLAAEGSAAPPPVADRGCDCFFVVDSCLSPEMTFAFGKDVGRGWNVPFSSPEHSQQAKLAEMVLEQMRLRMAANGSCFNKVCRIYAPVYRQVAVAALMHLRALAQLTEDPGMERGLSKPEELDQAMNLAYGDVRTAFQQFLADPETKGRPLILAAHSQGAMHLLRLLQEEVEGRKDITGRLVHVYMAGFAVPMDIFNRTLHNVRPSSSRTDICTVSCWRTAAVSHPNSRPLRIATYYAGKGWLKTEGEVLSNNPISWRSELDGPSSSRKDYAGALWPLPTNIDVLRHEGKRHLPSGTGLRFGRLCKRDQDVLGLRVPHLLEVDCGEFDARVDGEGVLRVPHVPKESIFHLTERDWLLYHDLDFALFHNNLQDNVAVRLAEWREPGSSGLGEDRNKNEAAVAADRGTLAKAMDPSSFASDGMGGQPESEPSVGGRTESVRS